MLHHKHHKEAKERCCHQGERKRPRHVQDQRLQRDNTRISYTTTTTERPRRGAATTERERGQDMFKTKDSREIDNTRLCYTTNTTERPRRGASTREGERGHGPEQEDGCHKHQYNQEVGQHKHQEDQAAHRPNIRPMHGDDRD